MIWSAELALWWQEALPQEQRAAMSMLARSFPRPVTIIGNMSDQPLRKRIISLGKPLGITPKFLVRVGVVQIQLIDFMLKFIGGPGRTRTCNQTVMSGRL